jgi:hypothetical protein
MQDLISYLILEGTQWVAKQRDHHRPLGRRLTEKEWTALAPYYSANILETVVIRSVPVIENPDFYQTLSASGPPIPLDFSQMDGITFIDTIAIQEQQSRAAWKAWLSLLFHECVHVCQYKLLGLERFIEQYIRGWASNGRDYYAIPLEVHAYRLQHAFETNGSIFSVEELVRSNHVA